MVVCLILLALLLLRVPFLTSGSEVWLGIDWVDGRKLFSIDDAYRYFAAKNAFELQSVFLWNYVMPVALLFDATIAAITDGSLLGMRLFHAGVGVITLVVIARASLRAGCGPVLALASVLIVGLMPLYLILSSSFYGEGLFALLLAVAFLLFIDERNTLLAITVGLLPMVRPEGAIYCVLFLLYFGLRRDAKRCALIALPAIVYLAAVLSISEDWLSSVTWRLELRKILSPLSPGIAHPLSFDRLPNPLWACLALASPLIRRYRKWWPILVGPLCLIVIQASAITSGIQDFELRYFFSVIPIFGVAWAFPIRKLLDVTAELPSRRRLFAALTTAASLAIVAGHMFQSDWVRLYFADSDTPLTTSLEQPNVGSDFGNRTLLIDPKPLRAFAGRADSFLNAHENIRTVFIANSVPLYFLDFLENDPYIEPVLIPHNAAVAAHSGGYFFGFSLKKLAYQYYRFDPDDAADLAPAMLIVVDAGQDPFYFVQQGANDGMPTRRPDAQRQVTAKIQSGSVKAYTVTYSSQDSVRWSIPSPEATQ